VSEAPQKTEPIQDKNKWVRIVFWIIAISILIFCIIVNQVDPSVGGLFLLLPIILTFRNAIFAVPILAGGGMLIAAIFNKRKKDWAIGGAVVGGILSIIVSLVETMIAVF